MKKKNQKWIRKRHAVITMIARVLIGWYCRLLCGIKVDRFREQGKRPYLIIMNHQTVFDQFFIGMAFRGPVYYIATEDIFSMGWISRLLEFAVAPIPIKKQATDLKAVRTCVRIAKEGGTIALAPEGNRTYSGYTVYMKPSIFKLVRMLKLPLAIFRIEGGYGVQPRWSKVVRHGKMHAGVWKVVEPEEYQKMSDEELLALIHEGLDVNEAKVDGTYRHRRLAEYLERVFYVCPDCGLSEFHSRRDTVTCKTCGRIVRYLPTKEFEGVEKPFPFRFVADWYRYQEDVVSALDPQSMTESPVFTDTARWSRIILYKHKEIIDKKTTVSLYGDRIEVTPAAGEPSVWHFDDVSVITVLGQNKLNVYIGEDVFQLKGSARFNALKYMQFYHHYQNRKEGITDGEFLGL